MILIKNVSPTKKGLANSTYLKQGRLPEKEKFELTLKV